MLALRLALGDAVLLEKDIGGLANKSATTVDIHQDGSSSRYNERT